MPVWSVQHNELKEFWSIFIEKCSRSQALSFFSFRLVYSNHHLLRKGKQAESVIWVKIHFYNQTLQLMNQSWNYTIWLTSYNLISLSCFTFLKNWLLQKIFQSKSGNLWQLLFIANDYSKILNCSYGQWSVRRYFSHVIIENFVQSNLFSFAARTWLNTIIWLKTDNRFSQLPISVSLTQQ